MQFHMDNESATGSDMKNYIDHAEAIDDTTVAIYATTTDEGKAVNPLQVTAYLPKLYILQKAYLETVSERNGGDPEAIKLDTMEDLVSSGPYKPYVSNDQKVVFIRDDNYWGQADSMWGKLPAPKYLAHTIYKDNAAGQTALAQGEVDVCQQFITDVQSLWEDEDLPISTYLDEAPYGMCLSLPTIWFNTEEEGLDQVAVRKAIAMATDFDQIIASAMSGQSPTFDEVPRSIMNPTEPEQALVDQDALAEYQWDNADVEGAKALLDEAGIVDTDGDGIREYNGTNLSFTAECPTGWTDWNATLEIIAQAGQNIGIDISTYFPEASTYYDDLTTCKFDIAMWTGPGTSVANPYLRAMSFLSSTYNDLEVNWSGNYGHYTNERADEILELIPYETDETVLKEYYTELSQIWLEDVPSFAAMYRPQAFQAVNETVWTGFAMQDDGSNIPPLDCTDGYAIADLYNIYLVDGE
jgi:peptide/nickel transport system substrate-binding protein